MTEAADRFVKIEREVLSDRFTEFQRGVIQDNILLCDAKSGVLLAFCSAIVIFCIDSFVKEHALQRTDIWHQAADGLFLVAGLGFLISCHFALMTVLPRLVRTRNDHLFWDSPTFKMDSDAYLAAILSLEHGDAREERHRHIHMLAGICRSKFANFTLSTRFAQAAFAILICAELGRVFL